MTFEDIILHLRQYILDDAVEPYGWSDVELITYTNETIKEFCRKCQYLIQDSNTTDICQIILGYSADNFAEGTNSATIEIVEDIDITVDEATCTVSAEDNVAMTACAEQAVSTYCRYLLSADSNTDVTITKGDDSDTDAGATLPVLPSAQCPIGVLLIQTDATHTFTCGTTDLSATGITAAFESATHPFQVDESVVQILRAKTDRATRPLEIHTIQYMDFRFPNWENHDSGCPRFLVRDTRRGYYRFYLEPDRPDRMVLTVARYPVTVGTATTLDSSYPEIPEQYHELLYDGIAFRAFSKRDSEAFDPTAAKQHLAAWLNAIEEAKREEIRHRAETNQEFGFDLGGVL